MALIVQKFGGSSLSDIEKIKNAAALAATEYRHEHRVVMVVSAQGKTTDQLLKSAGETCLRPSERECDALLATGEQASCALMAMTLCGMGIPAVSLCGWQAGVFTDRSYGRARIRKIDTARILRELAEGRVVVVAGFQGVTEQGDVTTIGRGGSDTTAVALAAALKADVCRIYTDVDGVYSADPHIVPEAVKHYEIDYDEMLELASLGAKVLHNRSVEMAKRFGVPLEVRSSFTNRVGTKVRGVTVEQKNVSGVARDNNVAMVRISGMKPTESAACRLFSYLADKKISVDIILQPQEGEIVFSLARNTLQWAVEALDEGREALGFERFSVEERVCKVSIVGVGMANSYGVAARMLQALSEAKVPVRYITTSEIKISVIVPEEDGIRATTAVHAAFF